MVTEGVNCKYQRKMLGRVCSGVKGTKKTGEKEGFWPTCVEIHLLATNCPPQVGELWDVQLISNVDGILIFPYLYIIQDGVCTHKTPPFNSLIETHTKAIV